MSIITSLMKYRISTVPFFAVQWTLRVVAFSLPFLIESAVGVCVEGSLRDSALSLRFPIDLMIIDVRTCALPGKFVAHPFAHSHAARIHRPPAEPESRPDLCLPPASATIED